MAAGHWRHCPYGQPGDRLWVRETHFINDFRGPDVPEAERADCELMYRATDEQWIKNMEDTEGLRWRPSIHMPRWASRILLEVVSVRVERLQDISDEDCLAEGIHAIHHEGDGTYYHHEHTYADPGNWCHADDAYQFLWEQINGAGSWDANPWVWVVEFKQLNAKGGQA